eukprot:7319079-Prymnesium_polylepis.1
MSSVKASFSVAAVAIAAVFLAPLALKTHDCAHATRNAEAVVAALQAWPTDPADAAALLRPAFEAVALGAPSNVQLARLFGKPADACCVSSHASDALVCEQLRSQAA